MNMYKIIIIDRKFVKFYAPNIVKTKLHKSIELITVFDDFMYFTHIVANSRKIKL
jgi:hypothetical protein